MSVFTRRRSFVLEYSKSTICVGVLNKVNPIYLVAGFKEGSIKIYLCAGFNEGNKHPIYLCAGFKEG